MRNRFPTFSSIPLAILVVAGCIGSPANDESPTIVDPQWTVPDADNRTISLSGNGSGTQVEVLSFRLSSETHLNVVCPAPCQGPLLAWLLPAIDGECKSDVEPRQYSTQGDTLSGTMPAGTHHLLVAYTAGAGFSLKFGNGQAAWNSTKDPAFVGNVTTFFDVPTTPVEPINHTLKSEQSGDWWAYAFQTSTPARVIADLPRPDGGRSVHVSIGDCASAKSQSTPLGISETNTAFVFAAGQGTPSLTAHFEQLGPAGQPAAAVETRFIVAVRA